MKYFLLIVAVCLTSPATAYLKESSGVIVRSLPRRVLYVYPRNEQSANSLFSLRPRGSPKASGRKSDALHPQASKGSDIDPQKHATDPRSDQSPFLRSGGPNSASRPPLPPSFRSNMAVAREAKVAALRGTSF